MKPLWTMVCLYIFFLVEIVFFVVVAILPVWTSPSCLYDDCHSHKNLKDEAFLSRLVNGKKKKIQTKYLAKKRRKTTVLSEIQFVNSVPLFVVYVYLSLCPFFFPFFLNPVVWLSRSFTTICL